MKIVAFFVGNQIVVLTIRGLFLSLWVKSMLKLCLKLPNLGHCNSTFVTIVLPLVLPLCN